MHREYHEFYTVHVYLRSIRISLLHTDSQLSECSDKEDRGIMFHIYGLRSKHTYHQNQLVTRLQWEKNGDHQLYTYAFLLLSPPPK